MQIKTTLAVSIALLMSTPILAESTFRQHDAHVHGHVEFNIAQDAHDLLIEVTAPGADVVGFEHAPQNAQQKEKLASAVNILNDVDNIFALNASAKCELEFKSVTHTLGGDDHKHHDHDKHDSHDDHKHHDHDKHDSHDDHKHHDHDKHDSHDDHKHHDHDKHEGHDDHKHHDHDKHDSHDDHKHHDHDHSGGHGEFTIEYHFHCDNIDKLQSISTEWFTQFETTESVSINLLTDKAQSATKLSPGSNTISF
ncbi:DUF2796 domain-containing protein [Vibrio sp. ZSDE26]|uniref:DUF2796 domain-containing protein n=1 Tax=Vibrio amylolyticus TaxID=2847292 RepID=A0A9X1XIN5_9VIBR|nr:DUF2796 domain-containing protein [Vibrio amylolyticus]MCK6263096.1 DUF2796 domain-containing protein [Vibrio amylolyticus]